MVIDWNKDKLTKEECVYFMMMFNQHLTYFSHTQHFNKDKDRITYFCHSMLGEGRPPYIRRQLRVQEIKVI